MYIRARADRENAPARFLRGFSIVQPHPCLSYSGHGEERSQNSLDPHRDVVFDSLS